MAEFWFTIFHDLHFYKLSIQTPQSAFSSIFLSAGQHIKCQLYCLKVAQSLSNINSDKTTIKQTENLVKLTTNETIRFNPV